MQCGSGGGNGDKEKSKRQSQDRAQKQGAAQKNAGSQRRAQKKRQKSQDVPKEGEGAASASITKEGQAGEACPVNPGPLLGALHKPSHRRRVARQRRHRQSNVSAS